MLRTGDFYEVTVDKAAVQCGINVNSSFRREYGKKNSWERNSRIVLLEKR